jgi:transcription elongation GreA/GreB family factor
MAEKKPSDALIKLARAEDAKKATAEYHAAAAAVDKNTARLRALRLEREAAATAEAPAAKPAKPKAAKKAKPATTGTLAGYLKERKGTGRSS